MSASPASTLIYMSVEAIRWGPGLERPPDCEAGSPLKRSGDPCGTLIYMYRSHPLGVPARPLGDVQLGLNASYLLESEDQFSPLRPVVQKVGRIFNPARLRMRGGASFSRGASTASLYVSYVHSYEDDQSLGVPRHVSSWTTFDASYQYTFGGGMPRLFSGTRLTLSVQNLFDKDPPLITTAVPATSLARTSAYDSANADPLGRVIGVQLTKQW